MILGLFITIVVCLDIVSHAALWIKYTTREDKDARFDAMEQEIAKQNLAIEALKFARPTPTTSSSSPSTPPRRGREG